MSFLTVGPANGCGVGGYVVCRYAGRLDASGRSGEVLHIAPRAFLVAEHGFHASVILGFWRKTRQILRSRFADIVSTRSSVKLLLVAYCSTQLVAVLFSVHERVAVRPVMLLAVKLVGLGQVMKLMLMLSMAAGMVVPPLISLRQMRPQRTGFAYHRSN